MPSGGFSPTPNAPVLASGSDSGLAGDNITKVTTPTIEGIAAPGALVSVYLNGALVDSDTFADGQWSFTLSPLAEGSYDVTVTAELSEMAPSDPSPPLTFVIDLTPPTARPTVSLDPAGDSGLVGDRITTDITPTLRGQATPLAMVEILVDGIVVGATSASATGGWTFTPVDTLELGSRVVTAQEVDAAGNAGPASRDLSLMIAGAAPAAPGLAVASDGGAIGDGITNDNTPTITGVAAAFADIRLLVGGRLLGTTTAGGDGAWSITPTQALTDGRHELRVQSILAGVVSDVSDPLALVIDTVAPATDEFLNLLLTADDGSGVRQWFSPAGGTFAPVVNIAPLGGSGIDGGVTPVVLGMTDRVLFAGDDGVAGTELWVTDGTPAGTESLTDRPGSFAIRDLTATADGRAVFAAVDALDGTQVWVTDGSAFGTYALTDGDLFTAIPGQFTAVADGRVFFVAETAAYGRELWVTDGTAAGTALFLDAAPGAASGQVGPLAALEDGSLLFVVDDGTGSVSLRKASGGTTATITGWNAYGGVPVSISDIVPVFADVAVVIADVTGMGEEAFLVRGGVVVSAFDFTPGPDGSFIQDFTSLRPDITVSGGMGPDVFVFTYFSVDSGRELGFMTFEGASPSGGLLVDIAPGVDSSNITGLTAIGDGRAVFSAEDVAGNAELWVTDGTSYGTYMVREIRDGALGSAPRDFSVIYPGAFLFSAIGDGGDREVWISDGTIDVAFQIADLNTTGYSSAPTGPAEVVTLADGRVVFNARTAASGTELWVSDGYRDGLYRLTDAFAGAAGSDPAGLVVLPNQKVLFTLDDPASGRELWVTDGTEAGTSRLADINPTAGSNPGYLALLDASSGRALFAADDGAAGRELWVTDGTAAGTTLLKDINPGAAGSDVEDIVSIATGKALFTADDGVSGRELWITDGTAAGTYLLKDVDEAGSSSPRAITALGNGKALFATQAGRLWITDGTTAGTTQLGDIDVSGVADPFTAIGGGRAIFLGLTATEGSEAWVTDGTEAGTRLLKDIRGGAGGSAAGDFTLLSDGQVLFRADDDIHGAELWITDLTTANTRLLADIEPGIDSSAPGGMVETIGGRVVFAATTVDYGRELWVFDSGTGDTYQLLDLNDGAASSDPGTLTRMADGNVVFWADDGVRGRELWITDGTAAGTRLFSNTDPGSASSNPLHFLTVFTPGGMEAPNLDETSDTGVLNNDRLTNDTTPLVWGYGEAGTTARVFVNDVFATSATADSFGVWETDLPTLAEGTHRITFTLTDQAGNVSAVSPAVEITVDTTPAEASFTALPVISTVPTLHLDGTVSEGSAEVRLLLDGPSGTPSIVYAPVQDEGGGVWSWSYSIVAAQRGDWTITVTAVDDAGNEDQTPSAQTITLRPSAPPVLAGLAATLTLSTPQIEAGPVRLDPDVTVTDPDGVFFSGRIVVSGQLPGDAIGIAATSAISLSGTDITHAGLVVGSVSGGTGPADLVITLTSTVTVAAVEAVVEAITFASSAELGEERRTLTVTLDDGLGGTTSRDVVVDLAGRRLSGGNGAETLEGTARADRLDGFGGDDVLTGRGGADTLVGGGGNDLLQGEDHNDTLDGGLGADTLVGGQGNDILDGGLGTDRMVGDAGNDLFIVDDAGDEVVEAADGGIDRVNTALTYTLVDHVEHLLLTGTADVNGTGNALVNLLTGNAGANRLDGDAGNDTLNGAVGADTLIGGEGNDILDGGLGTDRMVGDAGNDLFIVDDAGDVVVEAAEGGIDRVNTALTYTLVDHVEHLLLTGSADVNGTGNGLVNLLTGNAGANRLDGDAGNDTLNGAVGADTLIGGEGNDILDGGLGTDRMVGDAGNDLFIVDDAGDVVVEAAEGGIDRVNTALTYTLVDHVEHLLLTGSADVNGTGNGLFNLLTGNAGANRLDGDAGNDTLNGAVGADTLIGGEGNDILDGGLGTDRMVGDAGNDLFIVDDSGDVVVEAADGGIDRVNTALTYTLVDHVEHLLLTGTADVNGTGNGLVNLLTGNAGANRLDGDAGNDTLNGAVGADTLIGGEGNDILDGGLGTDRMVGDAGNDLFIVDDSGDVVVEAADGGIDRVNTALTYTLVDHVEHLLLTGTADVNGTGNGLVNLLTGNAGANRLDGDAGNDTLNGAVGADTLIGGEGNDILDGGLGTDRMVGDAGNDLFIVDDAGDVVVEAADGGIDRVNTALTYTLVDHVEHLLLTGAADVNGTGNALVNLLTGNAGANRLDGDAGNDTLNGGTGADTLVGGSGLDRFVFSALDSSQAASPDIILDFTRGQDRVQVDAIDPSTAPGNQAFLWIGSAAFTGTGTAEARIWQDGADTYAGFDDGSGGEAEMVIRFTGLLNLTAADFIL